MHFGPEISQGLGAVFPGVVEHEGRWLVFARTHLVKEIHLGAMEDLDPDAPVGTGFHERFHVSLL